MFELASNYVTDRHFGISEKTFGFGWEMRKLDFADVLKFSLGFHRRFLQF